VSGAGKPDFFKPHQCSPREEGRREQGFVQWKKASKHGGKRLPRRRRRKNRYGGRRKIRESVSPSRRPPRSKRKETVQAPQRQKEKKERKNQCPDDTHSQTGGGNQRKEIYRKNPRVPKIKAKRGNILRATEMGKRMTNLFLPEKGA